MSEELILQIRYMTMGDSFTYEEREYTLRPIGQDGCTECAFTDNCSEKLLECCTNRPGSNEIIFCEV